MGAERLITLGEAQRMVADSDGRKEEIRRMMNVEIRNQATKGLKWATFPSGLNQKEKDWLADELAILGYDILVSQGQVKW